MVSRPCDRWAEKSLLSFAVTVSIWSLYHAPPPFDFSLMNRIRFAAFCFLVSFPIALSAQTVSLDDGISQLRLRTASSGPTSNNLDWVIYGGDVGMTDQWFVTVDGVTTPLVNGIVTPNDQLSANVAYTVADIEFNFYFASFYEDASEEAMISIVPQFTNMRSESVDLTISNYIDFDLPPNSNDDPGYSSPFPSSMGVDDGTNYAVRYFNDAVRFESADLSEGLYERVATGEMLDATNSFTVGNFTAAAQWDFTLAAGEQNSIFVDGIARAVPEPNGILVLSLIGLSMVQNRRRRL